MTAETTSLVDSDVQHSFLSFRTVFASLGGDAEGLDDSHDDDGQGQHIITYFHRSAGPW